MDIKLWPYDFKLCFDVIKQDKLKKKVFTNVYLPPFSFKKYHFYTIGSKNESPSKLMLFGVHLIYTIIRHSVKKLAQSDDWFQSYGQNTVILGQFFKMAPKWQCFGHNFGTNHLIELIFSLNILQLCILNARQMASNLKDFNFLVLNSKNGIF